MLRACESTRLAFCCDWWVLLSVQISHLLPPAECVQFLLNACFTEALGDTMHSLDADSRLYMFLFGIRGAIVESRSQRLLAIVDTLLPRLIEGANHSQSHIRKCAIVALAEVCLILFLRVYYLLLFRKQPLYVVVPRSTWYSEHGLKRASHKHGMAATLMTFTSS